MKQREIKLIKDFDLIKFLNKENIPFLIRFINIKDQILSSLKLKTINNQSLIGEGNITISSGSGSVDGGFPESIYLASQSIDGGGP
jgi:hypothetical protein